MARQIRKVAVIGSGVMGSGIAAHLANVGIPSLLLDIVPNQLTEEEQRKGLTLEDRAVRNRLATLALKKLQKQKPAPLSRKSHVHYIQPGNLEDDVEKLAEVDWIIEVVVENLDVKKQLFEKVDQYRKQGTLVSSNTSGISIEAMAKGRSEDFQAHFLGTHFFNPPRYLKLLEIIPTKKTKPEVTAFMKAFAEDVLGKGVVEGKDTPNFIANRIGTYGLLVTVQKMLEGGYSVGEVDSVTGPLIGRPKSATFRTLDVVGLDTFLHVAKNVHDVVDGEEKDVFDPPVFMKKMAENGWIGSKSGQGFFLKQKGENGSEILELNPSTLEYEKRKKMKAPSIEQAKQAKSLNEKLSILIQANDRAGQLLWNLMKPVLIYSAEKVYEIAGDIKAVDDAMKWGFGWEQGPFEMWDAIGVASSVQRMEEEGATVPSWVKEMLTSGRERFYQDGTFYHHGEAKVIPINGKIIHLKALKPERVITKNSGASLIDLGDDVALLEFHSPSNSIGFDVVQMINKAVDEVEANYKGLVIGNQGKNFCVGANLMMILMEAQDDNFFEIDMVVRQFQQAMAKIRYSQKPVVSAPFAMTLGGGTEICLPTASIQASLETYMGLVEVGVGVIPGGGGNKELYLRHLERLPEGANIDLQSIANKTFETIAMAKVSTSAHEAMENGFLSERDGVVVNGDHLLYQAKQQVIHLHDAGYRPPARKKIPVVGETGYATMLLGAKSMKFGGMISEHDLKIAEKLAFVIAGGRVAKGTLVDEQYLLDLEREAFLSLVGEPKSQQRMQHMLMKGKPLRN
ncbi:3-hydroxyacyl-CoA dehydrogenase/enoyl-CoA hydratase family protein [Halalkalibacterium halodurans]|uniref:3-hydroxyacyl-CoA dehydrogenase/enoyl-CoA hydratase family protein n=1 Tax=Halalkalibacterium halodurans TaxID=86665 RepID=UPI002AA9E721|nr:3-hydroxyacyl-CoA dehydrogenase/enoyl-CoA hydratase family protein [Halalkalibacterium halodurans]MDY7224014.1 3-hydroxyacyl-CoA dehydrogenase/enoyl-CoA hydratase family protein [Halalkalibacterium halodurans]MDY7243299.1 3-hydroxyacyl-CoA dehydrogenase/enoyl-CoA hydratase family protein [Halalkalibacterium halodurans]